MIFAMIAYSIACTSYYVSSSDKSYILDMLVGNLVIFMACTAAVSYHVLTHGMYYRHHNDRCAMLFDVMRARYCDTIFEGLSVTMARSKHGGVITVKVEWMPVTKNMKETHKDIMKFHNDHCVAPNKDPIWKSVATRNMRNKNRMDSPTISDENKDPDALWLKGMFNAAFVSEKALKKKPKPHKAGKKRNSFPKYKIPFETSALNKHHNESQGSPRLLPSYAILQPPLAIDQEMPHIYKSSHSVISVDDINELGFDRLSLQN